MSKFENILTLGSKALSLEDDLKILQDVKAIFDAWDKLSGNLQNVNSAGALIELIAGGLQSPELENAADQAGVSEALASIQRNAALLSDPNVLKLLDKIEKFNEDKGGVVDWELLQKTKSFSGGSKPEYTLDLSANAALRFEAGDKWVFGKEANKEPLMSIGFKAGIDAKASAKLPFGVINLGIGGKIDRELDCDFYFKIGNTQQTFAAAVLDSIPAIPNPFDFESIWDSFNAANSELKSFKLAYGGELGASVTIGLGKSFDIGGKVKVDLGGTVKVGIKRPSSLILSMQADDRVRGKRAIRFILSRNTSKERNFNLGLDLGIDLSGASKDLHRLLSDAFGKWENGLEHIRPFLSPGSYIQSQLSSQLEETVLGIISNDSLQQAITSDLQVIIGLKSQDETAVAEWLKTKITQRIDEVGGGLILNAKNAAANTASKLADDLPSVVPANIKNELLKRLEGLFDQVGTKFEAAVKDAFNKTDSKSLGTQLGEFGDTSSKAVKNADDALKRVRGLMDRYSKLFRKILKETENSARAKISASIQYEDLLSSKTSYELAGTFFKRDEKTRGIFDLLRRGKYQEIAELFSIKSDSFELDQEKSSITRFSKQSSGWGYELIVFGFGISGGSLGTGSAEVKTKGNGDIQVLGYGGHKKWLKNLEGKRETEFITTTNLLAAKNLSNAPLSVQRSAKITFSFSHEDKSLTSSDVSSFVGSLYDESDQDLSIIDADAVSAANSTFSAWANSSAGDEHINGAVALRMTFDTEQLEKLLGLNFEGSVEAYKRHVFNVAMSNSILTEALSKKDWKKGLSYARKKISEVNKEIPTNISDYNWLYDAKLKRQSGKMPGPRGKNRNRLNTVENYTRLRETFLAAKAMAAMIENMRKIYFSDPTSPNWTQDEYRETEHKIAENVGQWMHLNTKFLFWFDEDVHEAVQAFILTLNALAGPKNSEDNDAGKVLPNVSIALSHNPAHGRSVTKLIL